MNKATGVIVALLLFSLTAEIRAGDESERIEFDIYQQNHQMVVWIDLSSVITSKRVAQMKDGIGMALEYQLSLFQSRRFWGSHKLEHRRGVFHIGYRLITEDYFISELTSHPPLDKQFLSLGELHGFLADSININLAEIDSLDYSRHYSIQMALTCISLTSLNLSNSNDDRESGQSAVKWLFKEFLDLTNFGRQNYSIASRLFSLSELSQGR